ncbi:hypothetical protein [Pararcticibacter amylolyticus]|uniref:Uncharacterized protein n=1 Tax=Pararcticibacter amylolyticus TaxID=2173175 RepID=A0A2U2PAF5_9SPHI|nr:hypothetical protein [Pararcticibacter amylolyticus]PWG78367.1 hypothetical protein DDR33_22640 [Pararcticibacter amylolyticus]
MNKYEGSEDQGLRAAAGNVKNENRKALKTEWPLTQRDEVKIAEERTRRAAHEVTRRDTK